MDQKTIWNKKHSDYKETEWIDVPSLFAQWAIKFFPPRGPLLELGTGQGQDARYFTSKGYSVTATDFSDEALKIATAKSFGGSQIDFKTLDLTKPLKYPDESYDIVYAHLSLHYFDKETTSQIFSEIHRILTPGGIVAVLVNTTEDPELTNPEKTVVEKDYYEINGIKKRFFSISSLKSFAGDFKALALDSEGETYKDRAVGNTHLIRFIGEK